ncbi:hypothetical protein EDB81DRAFT_790722 [Dactylonectria macrodidyma]|uniref:Uncharacterized protein n=1 Tax=Dactylonectria macrodidyma TaxID=307937 RepID=A0A9P9F6G6_9HYPO|nr:hypothetical protein EDB81DRAFT_790722 [Dactylonectria macrodidyma]
MPVSPLRLRPRHRQSLIITEKVHKHQINSPSSPLGILPCQHQRLQVHQHPLHTTSSTHPLIHPRYPPSSREQRRLCCIPQLGQEASKGPFARILQPPVLQPLFQPAARRPKSISIHSSYPGPQILAARTSCSPLPLAPLTIDIDAKITQSAYARSSDVPICAPFCRASRPPVEANGVNGPRLTPARSAVAHCMHPIPGHKPPLRRQAASRGSISHWPGPILLVPASFSPLSTLAQVN